MAKILIGIPSYQEEKTIQKVTETIDQGIDRYLKKDSVLLVNADNNSPDRTKERFLQAKTKTPKKYLVTKKLGKGRNIRKILQEAMKFQANYVLTFDADLRSLQPDWLAKLLFPLRRGYHFVAPYYFRAKFDATITNFLCYPLIYGIFGLDLRQPIGGEFAFRKKLVTEFLQEKWPKHAYFFGIDIYLTTKAIISHSKIAQVFLGEKIHKSSVPNLERMFLEVCQTLFEIIIRNQTFWQKIKQVKEVPLFFRKKEEEIPKSSGRLLFKYAQEHFQKYFLEKDYQFLPRKLFLAVKKKFLDSQIWPEIVYFFLENYAQKRKTKLIQKLETLYFLRVLSYIQKYEHRSFKEAEKEIRAEAKVFWQKRNLVKID